MATRGILQFENTGMLQTHIDLSNLSFDYSSDGYLRIQKKKVCRPLSQLSKYPIHGVVIFCV